MYCFIVFIFVLFRGLRVPLPILTPHVFVLFNYFNNFLYKTYFSLLNPLIRRKSLQENKFFDTIPPCTTTVLHSEDGWQSGLMQRS